MGARLWARRIGVEVADGRIRTLAIRSDLTPAIAAELAAAGFDDAEEIGVGGFGVVYRCLQRALDRTVAIKVLTADLDPDNLERFLREQRAMGRLSGHPNIVNIFAGRRHRHRSALHRDAIPPAGFPRRADPPRRSAAAGRRRCSSG